MKTTQQLTPQQVARLGQLREEQGPGVVEAVLALATKPVREPRISGRPSGYRTTNWRAFR